MAGEDLTIENMDVDTGRVGVGGDTGVVARVRQRGLGDEELGGGSRGGLLSLQRDTTAGRVKVDHSPALVPVDRARRRRVHVNRAGERDGRPFLHVDILGAPDVRLSRCNAPTQ